MRKQLTAEMLIACCEREKNSQPNRQIWDTKRKLENNKQTMGKMRNKKQHTFNVSVERVMIKLNTVCKS